MVKNSYKGITFYLTNIYSDDLSFISNIIPLIDVKYTPKNTKNRPYYDIIIESNDYKVILTKKDIFINNPDSFPSNTPDNYKQARIEQVNINGNDLYKIYIPAITQSNVNLRITTDLLTDMLIQLFNKDILQAQSLTVKQSHEYDFSKGDIEIIKSSKSYSNEGGY